MASTSLPASASELTSSEGQVHPALYETEAEVDWETEEEGQEHSHDVPGGGTGSQSAGHTHRTAPEKRLWMESSLTLLSYPVQYQKFLALLHSDQDHLVSGLPDGPDPQRR